MIKVNLGCGDETKEGWVTIDKYQKADINTDIDDIPLESETVDMIYCSHVLEHIPFTKEKQTLDEIYRILKTGGELVIVVPDFKWIAETIIRAKDEWCGFYKVTDDILDPGYAFCHGPGNDIMHGELMTHVFGNQICEGQFHHNAYTRGKVKGIAKFYNYEIKYVRRTFYKGVANIIGRFVKSKDTHLPKSET
jgi:ubiquinone/menaquinone biosynthesis C-methylase UbiE